MAKYPRFNKLSIKEKETLLVDFCQALAALKTPQEVAEFLKDLLGPAELEMLAKRLQVAKYLIKGWTYSEIKELLKVSFSTIARVNFWLQVSGKGYRLVAERTKEPKPPSQFSLDMKALKRAYFRYFWPELLFEEIMKELGRRRKEKILKTLHQAEDKKEILAELNQYLREVYSSKRSRS
jgi:TrpR-related protein YerC/YecD